MELIMGQRYQVKAVRVMLRGLIVQFNDNTTGHIHISKISDEFVSNINDFVKIGETYEAECVKGLFQDVELSLKHLHLQPRKTADDLARKKLLESSITPKDDRSYRKAEKMRILSEKQPQRRNAYHDLRSSKHEKTGINTLDDMIVAANKDLADKLLARSKRNKK